MSEYFEAEYTPKAQEDRIAKDNRINIIKANKYDEIREALDNHRRACNKLEELDIPFSRR